MAQNALNLFKKIKEDPNLIDADPRLSAALRQTQKPAILNEWNATKQPLKERGFLAPLGVYEDGSVHAAWPSILSDPVEAFKRQIDTAYSRPQAASEDDAGNLYDANNNIIGNKYTDADNMIKDAFSVAGGATTGGLGAASMGMMDNALGSAGARLKYSAPVHHVKPEVQGSKELGSNVDALVNGKGPSEWGPDELNMFGEHYGVAGLGNATKPIRIMDDNKVIHDVPESFLDPSYTPSYYDQLALKAEGIDPNLLPDKLRQTIHEQMVKATTPEGPRTSDIRNYNGFLFGLSSPNNPLTPNQIAYVQTMAKTPNDIVRMANMTPWTLEEAASIKGGPKSDRQKLSKQIAKELGLSSAKTGGTGTVGSADWTRMSDFAKMMLKDPNFFRFNSNLPNTAQNWEEFIGRVATQVPGLSYKTGSFGGVWQNPEEAMISAMDRHMASKFKGQLFEDPKDAMQWEKTVISKFNKMKKLKGENKVTSIDDMVERVDGGRGYFVEQALGVLGRHKSPKMFINKKGERIENPSLPDHLRDVNWIVEPEKALVMSPAYSNALAANAEDATARGTSIFSSQWGAWDPLRGRFEPHENMNPHLQRIGRMSLDQIKAAQRAHGEAGFLESPNQIKKTAKDRPTKLALFANGPTAAIVPLATKDQDKNKKQPLRGGFGPRWEDVDEIVRRTQK